MRVNDLGQHKRARANEHHNFIAHHAEVNGFCWYLF